MQQGSNPNLFIDGPKTGILPEINGTKTSKSSQIKSQKRNL